jgi:serine/threonine protein kinase
MATVYRARQANVNREVAIKVIKEDVELSQNFIAHFSREAETRYPKLDFEHAKLKDEAE